LIKETYRLIKQDTRLAVHRINSILHGDPNCQKARIFCIYFFMPYSHVLVWWWSKRRKRVALL